MSQSRIGSFTMDPSLGVRLLLLHFQHLHLGAARVIDLATWSMRSVRALLRCQQHACGGMPSYMRLLRYPC